MQNNDTITNALSAAADPLLLETASQLARAAKAWRRQAVLGLDTEFVRERTYRADLGLVQVSDGRTAWLIDPITNSDLEPLKQLLSDPGICKVFHSASEDLEVLLNSIGALPVPMVDTQIACAMLGQPLQMGYHHAVKWLLDVPVDKDQTRSNWCRRPLHAVQLRYAAIDVVLLPMMHDILKTRLEKAGRWTWMLEDVERMQQRARQTVDPALAYLRIPRIGNMEAPSLRVLQALAAWREETASKRNRARGFVVRDQVLTDMANLKPRSRADFKAIADIHPTALERYQDSWLELIRDALESDRIVELPAPLSGARRRQLKLMRQAVIDRAAELEMDPALLASRRELEKLIRAQAEGLDIPERFGGWRQEVITESLLKVNNP